MSARVRFWRSLYYTQVKASSQYPGRTMEPATATQRKEQMKRAPERRLTLVKR
jgi:hypothetical protein